MENPDCRVELAPSRLEQLDGARRSSRRGSWKLKDRSAGDILVYGSASVVHAVMPHGLVDEFRLMAYPTVLGRGKRLFPDGVKAAVNLVVCRQLGSGIVLLRCDATRTR